MTTISTTTSSPPPQSELDAYSIAGFCKRHSISRGTYYNMREAGTGPKEKRAMSRVLISKSAAADWLARQ